MSQHGYSPPFKVDSSGVSHEGDVTIDLLIETLTGTAFEMTVSPLDTVAAIKNKIQRIEGIPVASQHLLYNLRELEDSAQLRDCSISDGATLRLVLNMRGGPISTRIDLQDLIDVNSYDELMLEQLPPFGGQLRVRVVCEGEQFNFFRVLDNADTSYDDSSSTSKPQILDEPEDAAKRVQENTVTMSKVQELRKRLSKRTRYCKPKSTSAGSVALPALQSGFVPPSDQNPLISFISNRLIARFPGLLPENLSSCLTDSFIDQLSDLVLDGLPKDQIGHLSEQLTDRICELIKARERHLFSPPTYSLKPYGINKKPVSVPHIQNAGSTQAKVQAPPISVYGSTKSERVPPNGGSLRPPGQVFPSPIHMPSIAPCPPRQAPPSFQSLCRPVPTSSSLHLSRQRPSSWLPELKRTSVQLNSTLRYDGPSSSVQNCLANHPSNLSPDKASGDLDKPLQKWSMMGSEIKKSSQDNNVTSDEQDCLPLKNEERSEILILSLSQRLKVRSPGQLAEDLSYHLTDRVCGLIKAKHISSSSVQNSRTLEGFKKPLSIPPLQKMKSPQAKVPSRANLLQPNVLTCESVKQDRGPSNLISLRPRKMSNINLHMPNIAPCPPRLIPPPFHAPCRRPHPPPPPPASLPHLCPPLNRQRPPLLPELKRMCEGQSHVSNKPDEQQSVADFSLTNPKECQQQSLVPPHLERAECSKSLVSSIARCQSVDSLPFEKREQAGQYCSMHSAESSLEDTVKPYDDSCPLSSESEKQECHPHEKSENLKLYLSERLKARFPEVLPENLPSHLIEPLAERLSDLITDGLSKDETSRVSELLIDRLCNLVQLMTDGFPIERLCQVFQAYQNILKERRSDSYHGVDSTLEVGAVQGGVVVGQKSQIHTPPHLDSRSVEVKNEKSLLSSQPTSAFSSSQNHTLGTQSVSSASSLTRSHSCTDSSVSSKPVFKMPLSRRCSTPNFHSWEGVRRHSVGGYVRQEPLILCSNDSNIFQHQSVPEASTTSSMSNFIHEDVQTITSLTTTATPPVTPPDVSVAASHRISSATALSAHIGSSAVKSGQCIPDAASAPEEVMICTTQHLSESKNQRALHMQMQQGQYSSVQVIENLKLGSSVQQPSLDRLDTMLALEKQKLVAGKKLVSECHLVDKEAAHPRTELLIGVKDQLGENPQCNHVKGYVERKVPKKILERCSQCRKKLGLTNKYTCRCQKQFCSLHRYSETHECSYDYKVEGRRQLEEENPLVTAEKLTKV